MTEEELIEQLACIEAGIIWPGTADQIRKSVQPAVINGRKTQVVSVIRAGLDNITPEEAKKFKRRFRKLWRTRAKAAGFKPRAIQNNRSLKRRLAVEQAKIEFGLKRPDVPVKL